MSLHFPCVPWCSRTLIPVLAIPATQSPAHKQTIAVLKTVSLLTDRTSTHPSTSMKQERTNTKKKKAHSLVSFLSLSVSLCEDENNTGLRCVSPLHRLPLRPDIGLPLPLWSHRWRRWWSWKLAANSHSRRQFAVGEINMWGKVWECSHEPLTPLCRVTPNDRHVRDHRVFTRLQRLGLLTAPQWRCLISQSNRAEIHSNIHIWPF